MLTDILRDRFGLDEGYIGSDNENVEFLEHGYQGFADSELNAASMAIAAGVDQNMPGASYLKITQADLTSGAINPADLDRAVSNILRKKFASRLFDRLADETMARDDLASGARTSRQLCVPSWFDCSVLGARLRRGRCEVAACWV
jgi:beta-glucosidase